MSCRLHGYPWSSLATSPYRSSPLVGFQGYIPYPHIAAVCMFELAVLLLLGHMWGSIGVHQLWARPCFSSSVQHVWFKRNFFQTAVVSILLYGFTTWTLTKRLEKLDGNYTRLRAILNNSWRQYPTRHQLYGHLPPITKTIQVRRNRHA